MFFSLHLPSINGLANGFYREKSNNLTEIHTFQGEILDSSTRYQEHLLYQQLVGLYENIEQLVRNGKAD